MTAEPLRQIVDFILELDRLKGVTRKTRPLGLERYENSAEHSWQLALLATALAPHADAPVDVDRVIRMLLVHDVGEIAIALEEARPDADVVNLRFTDLWKWVQELPDFDDDPNRSNEKILEAIQMAWLDERD